MHEHAIAFDPWFGRDNNDRDVDEAPPRWGWLSEATRARVAGEAARLLREEPNRHIRLWTVGELQRRLMEMPWYRAEYEQLRKTRSEFSTEGMFEDLLEKVRILMRRQDCRAMALTPAPALEDGATLICGSCGGDIFGTAAEEAGLDLPKTDVNG